MRENLETSLKWTLAYEGGYVNHKDDPGGATNKGITQAVYDAHRRRLMMPKQSVRLITSDEVAKIYKDQYWDEVRGDDLPAGLDFAVWDFGVNSGTSRAAKELQKLVGVTVDGVIGEKTLAAVEKFEAVDLIVSLCEARLEFCKNAKNKKGKKLWPIFGKGWERRIMGEQSGVQTVDYGVIDRAVSLIVGDGDEVPMPTNKSTGKSIETPRESVVESKTMLASAAQIGTAVGSGATWFTANLTETERLLIMGFLGVGILLTLYVMRERIKGWADGWR